MTNKIKIKKKGQLELIIWERIVSSNSLLKPINLNDLDVSSIRDMNGIFENRKHQFLINEWDVSNVKTMSNMFANSKFNSDISSWDVRNVENMSYMFFNSNFNQDISKWEINNVSYMSNMFTNSGFDRYEDLNNWIPISFVKTNSSYNNNIFNKDELNENVYWSKNILDKSLSELIEDKLIEKEKKLLEQRFNNDSINLNDYKKIFKI